MTTEVIEVLTKARERLVRGGLYKGDYCPTGDDPDTCPVCIQGAVRWAFGGSPRSNVWPLGVFGALEACVPATAPRLVSGGVSLAKFNDLPETTLPDVLAVFDCAIAKVSA